MCSLLSVFILVLIVSFCAIANARRMNVIVKKTNGWHDSATIQSVDYEKLGRKSWDELTEVERYLLETEHALRGFNSDSVSEEYDYQEGEYDEIAQDNYEATDSEENVIEASDEDDEENSISDEAIEEGDGLEGVDNDNVNAENQSKEDYDESKDSVVENSGDSDESSEEDLPQEPSETIHHYNHRRRIGGRAARVWNTRQYQYYHLSVHYLINVYVKLRSKIDI